jgi:hypothetical protein
LANNTEEKENGIIRNGARGEKQEEEWES